MALEAGSNPPHARLAPERLLGVAAVALASVLLACGGGGSGATSGRGATGAARTSANVPGHSSSEASVNRSRDWTRFGVNAARYDAAPRGLASAAVAKLSAGSVSLPGTVDSSPIYLGGVTVAGQARSVVVMTTTYGKTLALDAASGQTLWTFTPASYGSLAGTAQITTATPVADPSRKFVYSASPDGLIHKLRLANGNQVRSGAWPTSVTRDATHEKLGTALNLVGHLVLVTTGGYIGDAPPYQGKVVAIDRETGRIVHVVNSLCSARRRIITPASCSASGSAIWGRAGAVVDPKTKRIYVTTGNGTFNGRTDWGDSVLELAPAAARLRRHYTPQNQAQLQGIDGDLGSTAPALLPPPGGGAPRYLLQGGKDGKLRLLRISSSLQSVRGSAGERLGGEVQAVPMPGSSDMFTAPAVLRRHGRTLAFVATGGATAAYRLRAGHLRQVWSNGTPGTSPVLAGDLLWVYDPTGGLNVYRPATGHLVRHLPAPSGHWNSPIIAGGRVYLPSGDANFHSTSGTLTIYS
jgi:outer membrane protein assembly factor BamB